LGDDNANECCYGPYGKINVASDDNEHHPNCENQNVGIPVEEVDHIVRGERKATRNDLKEHDQGGKHKNHAELPSVASGDAREEVETSLSQFSWPFWLMSSAS
jgi:hypothetical protein